MRRARSTREPGGHAPAGEPDAPYDPDDGRLGLTWQWQILSQPMGSTPVILAAFFWRRATAAGAVASIAAGTVVTIFWDKPFVTQHLPPSVAARDAILPALIVSLICLGLVSLLTARPTEAKLRPFTE